VLRRGLALPGSRHGSSRCSVLPRFFNESSTLERDTILFMFESLPHRCGRFATLFSLALLCGCSASPWESTYSGRRDPAAADAASRGVAYPVTVRTVPWERVEQTLRQLDADIAASDVHPDEWPPEKKAQVKSTLLKGLQVSESPDLIEVLGKSEFRTTDSIRPDTDKGRAELAAFAQRIGADMVIWSGRYLGKAERVVQEPVTTYSTGTDWGSYRGGRRTPSSFSESSTTWVPVHVQLDELAYIAYFLQKK